MACPGSTRSIKHKGLSFTIVEAISNNEVSYGRIISPIHVIMNLCITHLRFLSALEKSDLLKCMGWHSLELNYTKSLDINITVQTDLLDTGPVRCHGSNVLSQYILNSPWTVWRAARGLRSDLQESLQRANNGLFTIVHLSRLFSLCFFPFQYEDS